MLAEKWLERLFIFEAAVTAPSISFPEMVKVILAHCCSAMCFSILREIFSHVTDSAFASIAYSR